ncbi:MAG: hypothetical protein FJ144_24085 [Deltaproteobacteria bacterium]|nr:hypothetical protein [Deltaproteobacteria bacterium]
MSVFVASSLAATVVAARSAARSAVGSAARSAVGSAARSAVGKASRIGATLIGATPARERGLLLLPSFP